MWRKIGGFLRHHVIDWARELFTRPKTMAALFAGVLLAFGVNPQLAHQVAPAVAVIVSAIEQQAEPVDNLPPVVEGVPIIPNKNLAGERQ